MDDRAIAAELERDVMGAALMEALAALDPFAVPRRGWGPIIASGEELERAHNTAEGIRCLLRLPILDHARSRRQLELELEAARAELELMKVAP
jgi:hypothetical protein